MSGIARTQTQVCLNLLLEYIATPSCQSRVMIDAPRIKFEVLHKHHHQQQQQTNKEKNNHFLICYLLRQECAPMNLEKSLPYLGEMRAISVPYP